MYIVELTAYKFGSHFIGNAVFETGRCHAFALFLTANGGFQLLDLIILELKSHVIPCKFKSSHWLRANLVKDFFYK